MPGTTRRKKTSSTRAPRKTPVKPVGDTYVIFASECGKHNQDLYQGEVIGLEAVKAKLDKIIKEEYPYAADTYYVMKVVSKFTKPKTIVAYQEEVLELSSNK